MYDARTPEQIKADILAQMNKMDTREGSFADDMAGPTAVELFKLYGSLDAARYIAWPDETSGMYIDLAAEDIGIEPRKTGTRAETVLTVTGTVGFAIAEGTAFRTADDLIFRTRYQTIIPERGYAEIIAQAEKVGAAYNVAAEEIGWMVTADSRVTAVTNTAAAGGTDPESDGSLFDRVQAARKRPITSGNPYHYEQWALETPGIGIAKCTPIWDGPGTVKVLVADAQRQPVDEATVARCAAHIETERPVGAEVTVVSAQALAVDVAAVVEIESNTTIDAVQEKFRTAFSDYLRGLAFESYEVTINRVGAMMMQIDGVLDYSGLTLNGQAENVAVGAEQVPTAGEVSFA